MVIIGVTCPEATKVKYQSVNPPCVCTTQFNKKALLTTGYRGKKKT